MITFVDSGDLAQETAVDDFIIPMPAGVQSGDFLLAFMTSDAAPITWTEPGGWTVHQDDVTSGGNTSMVAYRTATGSEPANYTFVAGTTTAGVATITAWRGVDTAAPFNDASANSFTGTAQGWEFLETTTDECMIVYGIGSDNANAAGAGSYSAPGTYATAASFQNASQRNTLAVFYEIKTPAGGESGNTTDYTTPNPTTGTFLWGVALEPGDGAPPADPDDAPIGILGRGAGW